MGKTAKRDRIRLYTGMLLGVTARRVESHMTDEGGSIHLEYGVELERNFLGLNTYDIQVKTVEEGA